MPCYYTGSREGDLQLALDEKSDDFKRVLTEVRRRQRALTESTQLLCLICTQLESTEYGFGLIHDNPKLRKWWTKHKRIDARRKQLTRKRKKK